MLSKQITNFCIFFLLVSLSLIGVNFVVDPLQYYRRDLSPVFVKNQRFQIPGLVRNYSFDTIIVGTSHSENFLAAKLDGYMMSKSINLAISGSSAWEQSQVVNLALSKPDTKRVIWEMNYKSFAGHNPNLVKSGAFPNYLYEPGLTTPFYYLYSLDTFWLSVKHLLKRGSLKLDGLNAWFADHSDKFDGKHVADHYCELFLVAMQGTEENYQDSIKQYLEPVLGQNKEIEFVLFIPPLSVANFALNNQAEKFIAFREALYAATAEFENARVLDFVADHELIGNLQLYKDVEHYSLSVSNNMLAAMSLRQHEVPHDIKTLNDQFLMFVETWKSENHLCD